MRDFIRYRSLLAGTLLAIGVASGSGSAAFADGNETQRARGSADDVRIVSGFETRALGERTRTFVRKRQSGDLLVIDRWTQTRGPAASSLIKVETDEAEAADGEQPDADMMPTAGRAATGRSRETVQGGVRVINKRGPDRQ